MPSPSSSLASSSPSPPPAPEPLLTALVGEQLDMNYTVHELPTNPVAAPPVPSAAEWNLINRALLTRIESLEAENTRLKKCICVPTKQPKFTVEQIRDDDRLFSFYTGFKSYVVFLAFFLGPAVNKLNYWGSSTKPRQ